MSFYRALAPALLGAGVELHVIEGSAVYAAKDRDERVIEGVRIETLEHARLERWEERFSAFTAAPGLRRHLAASWAMWEQAECGEGCDVIEACDWGLLFVPPAIEAKRPLVVQCHGSVGQIGVHDPIAGEETQSVLVRLIERAALGAAQSIQTSSRANTAFWSAETGRDVMMLRPAAPPHSAPLPTGQPSSRGVVVGRVQRWKGPDVLCAALQRLGSRAPALDWIGRDTAWDVRGISTAGHLCRAFPSIWGPKINHRLPEPPDQIACRQASALFNLVPSTWDVFNFTAVEAMASGRPTIISSGAGASELVQDGENGFLFAAGDPQSLATALERVLGESPMRLVTIGQAARESVCTILNPRAIAAQRVAAYRAVIDDFRAKSRLSVEGWLGDICRPTEPVPGNEMAFLNHLPLRAIAAHALARGCHKVAARITPQVYS
jgi:glycosyltransferase involved in cell wall biosynthesis